MRRRVSIIRFGVLGALMLPLLVLSIRCVPVGHVGVVKRWGKVKHEATLSEGLNFIMPMMTSLEYISIKLRRYEQDTSASSRDLQIVTTNVSIQYSFVLASHLYQKMGDEKLIEHILMMPAVQESVKAVTAQFTAEELIKRRAEVKVLIEKQIEEFLVTTLTEKGLDKGSLTVANVAITDFDFSREFNESIEMKVKAEQRALQAKNEKEKKITDAEAVAEQITLESVARAKAIKREAKAISENPLIIEYKRMEKWDGKLPKLTGGVIPMFNVDDKK